MSDVIQAGQEDDLPPMAETGAGSGENPLEEEARKIFERATQEAIMLLATGVTGHDATRKLLQIERVAKCGRAAVMHLGAHSYPEESQSRGRRKFGHDRETMGVKAFEGMMAFGKQLFETTTQPKSIEGFLAAAEIAKRMGNTGLQNRLEAQAQRILVDVEGGVTGREAITSAATAALDHVRAEADVYEGASPDDPPKLDDVHVVTDVELGLPRGSSPPKDDLGFNGLDLEEDGVVGYSTGVVQTAQAPIFEDDVREALEEAVNDALSDLDPVPGTIQYESDGETLVDETEGEG
jgi:hypothetical protein